MIKNLIAEIEKQSISHPDLSLREFYKALSNLFENHPKTKKYLSNVVEKRTDIEISHLVNLIYRAIQYTLINHKDRKDMGEYTNEMWKKTLTDLLDNEHTSGIIIDKTLNENTQTNIYQRYVGPKALLSKLFPTKKIDIVDIGCSQNLGLMGIELNYPFAKVKDNTEKKELTKLIETDIQIDKSIGLDIEDPTMKVDWALACRFYPKELKQYDAEEQMIKFFKRNTKKTKFIQGSVLDIVKIWEKRKLPQVDAAITSLILYQLPDELKNKAIEEISKIIKDGGVLIVNDFIKVNSHIHWNVPWFENGQSNYRTIVMKKNNGKVSEPLEYILWDSGRCLKAYPGKDFHNI